MAFLVHSGIWASWVLMPFGPKCIEGSVAAFVPTNQAVCPSQLHQQEKLHVIFDSQKNGGGGFFPLLGLYTLLFQCYL